MSKGIKEKNVNRIIFDALILIFTLVLWYLYYNQLLYPVTGLFESDTAVHVSFAVEEHYYHSLAAFIYILLCKLPAENFTISLLLSCLTSGAILVTARLVEKILRYYNTEIPEYLVYIISFAANLVMGFYISACNKQHYIGYENANMWHNSTYIFMRFFALLTVMYFLDIFEKYKSGLKVKEWLIFSFLLALTTGFKASFLTVFAPLMAVMLLVDLIKGTKFSKCVIFGTTVLPSLLIMYIQSLIMGGTSSENGYAISPFTALSMRGDHPKVTLVLSVLFPLTVLVFHIKDFYKDKLYFGTLIMWAIAFLEVFLFVETGERKLDSNFMWGYSIALFFLFLMSMIRAVRDFYIKKSFVFYIQAAVLFWHVASGIWYIGLLLTGVTYFV